MSGWQPIEAALAWIAEAHADAPFGRNGRMVRTSRENAVSDADDIYGKGNYTLSPLIKAPNPSPQDAETIERVEAGERDMIAFGASHVACYLYPGEDQADERAAFIEGASRAGVPLAAETFDRLKRSEAAWIAAATSNLTRAEEAERRTQAAEGERDVAEAGFQAVRLNRDHYQRRAEAAEGSLRQADIAVEAAEADAARMREALELIAVGWEVIESDGSRMTIQAPEHWDEPGDRELIVDVSRTASCLSAESRLEQAEADAARLRELLRALEQANEEVCAGRSQAVHDAMIASGQRDALLALDEARRMARAALTPPQAPAVSASSGEG